MKKQILKIGLTITIIFCLAGCGHKHTFSDATCTEPKTCTQCGETEGEPLGHTVEIGTCDRCQKPQNYDLVTQIDEKIKSAENTTNIALYMIAAGSDISSVYNLIGEGLQYYEQAKGLYEEAYDLCSDYEELETLKKDINDVYEKLPLTLSNGNQDTVVSEYLNDMTVFVTAQAKVSLSMLDVMKLYQ